jgi:hypothetical protein
MSPPSRPPEPDPLKNLLDDAEKELRRRLEDACEADATGLSSESTEEIRRLEDNLLAAAMAAKQTVAVRRQIKRRDFVERKQPIKREQPIKLDERADRENRTAKPAKREFESGGEHSETPVMSVREFTDDSGRPWRAWPVMPGLTRASSSGRQFLGDFQNGWICFEGLGTSARRRLPRNEVSWEGISNEELQRLLAQAIDAPVREKKPLDKR